MKTNYLYEQEERKMWSAPNEYGETEYVPPVCPEGVDPSEYDKDMIRAVVSGILKDEYDDWSQSYYPYTPKYQHAELAYKEGEEKAYAVSDGYTQDGPSAVGNFLDMSCTENDNTTGKSYIDIPMHFASCDRNLRLVLESTHVVNFDKGNELCVSSWNIRVSCFEKKAGAVIADFVTAEAPISNGLSLPTKILGMISYDDGAHFENLPNGGGNVFETDFDWDVMYNNDFARAWIDLLVKKIIDFFEQHFIR